MHTFRTRSTSGKNTRVVIFTFIPLLALAFLGLKIAVITWVFFEVFLLFMLGICLFIVGRTHWEIEFRDDTISVYNTGNRQNFVITDLKQSDFIIKQSKKQKAKNTCDMKIANMMFLFYDVQSYQEMWAYIQANFPAERSCPLPSTGCSYGR